MKSNILTLIAVQDELISKKISFSFEKELKQFLPRKHHLIIRNFPAALEREIGRNI